MMIESALAVGFRSSNASCSSSSSFAITTRFRWSYDAFSSRTIDSCCFTTKTTKNNNRFRISADNNSAELNGKSHYHPFEEIGEPAASPDDGDAKLTAAETARTLIEVNSKATLMFSGVINEEYHENLFWPDLPYLTDEHGNIYFEVKDDEDILQSLTTEDNFVQVIIGLNTTQMLTDMEIGLSDIDFGFEEIVEEDDDDDDDDDNDDEVDDDEYEKDWVAILEDEDNGMDFDENAGDWAKLETMRSSHPMYFAKKMAEVTSDDPMNWMDQPPAGIAIQGLLRPALIDVIRKHLSDHQSSDHDVDQVGKIAEDNGEEIGINGHKNDPDTVASSEDGSSSAEESEKDKTVGIGTVFYKLEMIKIQLVDAHGNQTFVEVNDLEKAQPDAIAHSASKIITRMKDGGEKTTQDLKSLCWRVKGIQVEEARLIGIDSLGFDMRVCAGTQVQTLRFAFKTRATSEYSAERQLHDLMFPKLHHKPQKPLEARPKES